jgi:DNA (cytosine-5)-methyltransferase 1
VPHERPPWPLALPRPGVLAVRTPVSPRDGLAEVVPALHPRVAEASSCLAGARVDDGGSERRMTTPLVLSLFPGIGLLDMAFEEAGFCVVRGPDLLWGGDVRRFHPPAGRFDGVIGGPPCQMFSKLRHLNPNAGAKHGNLIPEYERVVAEAAPSWFVMENVEDAPTPVVAGYHVHAQMLRDVWVGGVTNRLRRFSFGTSAAVPLRIETLALHAVETTQSALAGGSGRAVPVKLGGSGKVKATYHPRHGPNPGPRATREELCERQGLPADFLGADEVPLTERGKCHAIGNGVPLPMGRAIAKAVRAAMYPDWKEGAA